MQMRVSLMLALRRSRCLFFGACTARPLSQRRIAPMAHFSAYSLQDYSAMPAHFPRCFVEELAQRPRAARLEEMTRFMERLGLRAPSDQTFGVMAATLLAVRGDDAPAAAPGCGKILTPFSGITGRPLRTSLTRCRPPTSQMPTLRRKCAA